MGNGESHLQLEGDAKQKKEWFDKCELKVIKETFKDLCSLSGDEKYRVDKETFLKYFPIPGLIGERLFVIFDKKNEGFLDYEEFLSSLAVLCRGSWEEKVKFVFKLYDVDGSNSIGRSELLVLLNHVPKDVIHLCMSRTEMSGPRRRKTINSADPDFHGKGRVPHAVSPPGSTTCVPNTSKPSPDSSSRLPNIYLDKEVWKVQGQAQGPFTSRCSSADITSRHDKSSGHKGHTHSEHEPQFLVRSCHMTTQEVVSKAFTECDLGRDGKLSFAEFKLWMERNPIMITFLQSVFPYDGNHVWDNDKKRLPFIHNRLFEPHGPGAIQLPCVESRLPPQSFPPGSYKDLLVEMGSGEDYDNAETRRLLLKIAKITTHPGILEEIPKLIERLNDEVPETNDSLVVSALDDDFTKTDETMAKYRLKMQNRASLPVGFTITNSEKNDGDSTSNGLVLKERSSEEVKSSSHLPVRDVFAKTNNIVTPKSLVHNNTIAREGWLLKKGQRLKSWKCRWCVLLGNCIYFYIKKSKSHTRGVMFLCGSFVEPVNSYAAEHRGYWGFDISRQVHGKESVRLFYTTTKADRDSWVYHLRHASKAIPIEEHYHIGQVLGKGRFSRVCVCVNKKTLERKAMKIIDKVLMDDEEKELVRSEIAIMKLIDHPNIVRMEDIYEGKRQIYIVMELYDGGELFDRIVGRSCFTEVEAHTIIYPLVSAIEYLHGMGIIHRDLKPENILCGKDLMDVKIADFGLSKLIFPDEVMKLPCGTLSYVAPEVLTLSGYGKEADIWSIGIIFYLLLCGGLPFDGDTRKEIIDKTINAELDLTSPGFQYLTAGCQDIILGMLNKDAKARLTATEILNHAWMLSLWADNRPNGCSAEWRD